MSDRNLIYIGGPTAVGKSFIASKVAEYFSTEIISCDSRQFYKEMNIGTAVPSKIELSKIKHHFIHDRSTYNHLSVGEFEKEAIEIITNQFKKNKILIMVGGSGLYADSILYGLDIFPKISDSTYNMIIDLYKNKGLLNIQNLLKQVDIEYYNKVDLNNHRRIIRALTIYYETKTPYSKFLGRKKQTRNFKTHIYIINENREKLYDKINMRVNQMIKNGLEKEAKSLINMMQLKSLQTVGYKEWIPYWNGECDKIDVINMIKINSRRYAKRQLTWFKKYESAKWMNPEDSIDYIINYHK
tara:strand:+ start:1203 stop:2099 length:897 start_codon:yes stop_codon:yes gene_type:complete